ncbi:MAG: 50S ribosomal protein L29 [Phycisphaerales bacterium]|nr:50S ribosomal protein L29 [Phycisphaerales bacterium]
MSKKNDFNKGLKECNENDLIARINTDTMRLKKLRLAHVVSPIENPMSMRNLRRDLARLKTELTKRKSS